MGHSDQLFQQALLYLQAAGHDAGRETRARLERLVQAHPGLPTDHLLEQMPLWFDLNPPAANPMPPIVRSSIGYGRD